MKLVRLNGDRQRDRRCVIHTDVNFQSSTLAAFKIICLFMAPFLFEKDTGGPAPSDPVCLPTQEGRRQLLLIQPPFTGDRLSHTARHGFRFFFSIFGACLQGAFMSQGKSFSFFFVMQPTSLSVCVCVARLWRCDVTVLVFPLFVIRHRLGFLPLTGTIFVLFFFKC